RPRFSPDGGNRDGRRRCPLFFTCGIDDLHSMSASVQVENSLESAARQAMARAASYLLTRQDANGHWCAELTADSTLESDYILFQLWLHPPTEAGWDPPSRALIEKAARSILDRQLSDGGFNIYVQGPSEISASIK